MIADSKSKTIALFSSGLDSYILYRVYKPEKLLYIDMGTDESFHEIKLLKSCGYGTNLKIIKAPFISSFELANKFIPFRNNILVLLAAQYANHIYIGVNLGDSARDKDFVFKAQMEGILNYFSAQRHAVSIDEYPYVVDMPYRNATKTEMVKDFVDHGYDLEELVTYSRSCYSDTEKECGNCRSCVRKAVALYNNGFDFDRLGEVFKVNPISSISMKNHKKMLSRTGERREGERQDYIKALDKAIDACKIPDYKNKIL